ncbi:hypothetical protein AX16_008059 [Volvariella volvacea WC 439]|nr:hypothetical protein AX16_008059 [Volvariella volvacea WC 439]
MSSTPPVIFKRTKPKPTQRTRPTSPEPESGNKSTDATEESAFELASKLKSKVKKSKQNPQLSFGGPDEEGAEEVFRIKKSKLSQKLTLRPREPEAMKQDPVQVVEDASQEGVKESLIPTETSIKTAKERRERLRKSGISTNEDFISLSVTRRGDFNDGPHPESRLMREEDELGEGDDEYAEYTSAQERIALGKKSRKAEAARRRDEMKELIADVEDEDEETMEWEQEQLRRGGHQVPEAVAPVRLTYQPAPIPTSTPLPVLGDALSRLTQQLAQLTTSHASNTSALNSLAQQRAEVDAKEQEMREMVGKAEEKRAWFGSFSDWVEGVANFLDEKYPLLERLEDEHLSLVRERFDMISKRRQEDDRDDLTTFLGEALEKPPSEATEKTDEFGREIPKPTSSSLRLQRRVARLNRHQQRQQSAAQKDEEGYSTDSSLLPDDAVAYEDAMKSLSARTVDVLSDVRAEEFHDPRKGRWDAWREKYADSYVNAWGGLGVVSVWEFWARLEIVGWNCIEDPRSLHAFHWYKGLYEYSRPGSGVVEERDLGSDGDLVASMITTAIIPRICKLIEGGALDVYSGVHIRRMIDLAEEIEASIETDSLKFQNLLKAVITTFQNAVVLTEEMVGTFQMGQAVLSFDPEAIPARQRFIARRVKLIHNLYRWRKYTGERYGIGALIVRILTAESSLLRIMRDGWDVGGREVSHRLAESIKPVLPEELYRELTAN